jgi:hypothetical protein
MTLRARLQVGSHPVPDMPKPRLVREAALEPLAVMLVQAIARLSLTRWYLDWLECFGPAQEIVAPAATEKAMSVMPYKDEEAARALAQVVGGTTWEAVTLAHGYLATLQGTSIDDAAREMYERGPQTLRRSRELLGRTATEGILPADQAGEDRLGGEPSHEAVPGRSHRAEIP